MSQSAELNESVELNEIDDSDVARWVGVPFGIRRPRYSFSATDLARFVEAMDNPNPLYFDPGYAASSTFGKIVAPQSYLGGGSGVGASAVFRGHVPGGQELIGGDEQWFYGPRLEPGDRLLSDAVLYDYRRTVTSFAGPTLFTRGETTYVNQRGEFICKQRTTGIRYLAVNARRLRTMVALQEEPRWEPEQLADLARRRDTWISSWPGAAKRLWGDVQVGEPLTERVIGPHTVSSFAAETLSDQGRWGIADGSSRLLAPRGSAMDVPITGSTEAHLGTDGAREAGLPRGYGFGATICVWIVDYLTNWAGEHGFLLHHKSTYRSPVLTGDASFLTGSVIDKWCDESGVECVVQVEYQMTNQNGSVQAVGCAELSLPDV